MAAAPKSPDDFQLALDRIAAHLQQDAGADAQQAAAMTVVLMLQSTQLPANLAVITERLAALLDLSPGPPEVQRNAAAALAACLEASDSSVASCLEHTVTQRAVTLLSSGSSLDASLELNLLVLLGTLAEASEATLQLLLDAEGAEQVLHRASPQHSPQLQEAAVDSLCKLAASGPAAKDAAAAAGAVPKLAALLAASSTSSDAAEISVRALLCLGMLVSDSPERQVELAYAPGAVAAVLHFMRKSEDGDCQQIAAGLFKELATNAAAKDAITAALKEQQAAEAALKFM